MHFSGGREWRELMSSELRRAGGNADAFGSMTQSLSVVHIPRRRYCSSLPCSASRAAGAGARRTFWFPTTVCGYVSSK